MNSIFMDYINNRNMDVTIFFIVKWENLFDENSRNS